MGPLGFGSPPARSVPLLSSDLRYYAQLRLPPALLGSLRYSLSLPNTLACFRSLCPIFFWLVIGLEASRCRRGSCSASTLPLLASWWEVGGSPKFPSYPFRHMPWSRTPVVSCWLAFSSPGLLPSAVGMRRLSQVLFWLSFVHQYADFRGSMSRPVSLLHSVSYAHCWFCTSVLLQTCWLGFDLMGFEFRLIFSHPLDNSIKFQESRVPPFQ